jgi:hypothetical protein
MIAAGVLVTEPWGESQAHGVRAPGRIVMVVREGSGWVLLQDGTRENLTATNSGLVGLSAQLWSRCH